MAREYGQFCGLARALEIVGGRWTLLIVRELLIGPKRFSELQEALPGIPTNILSSRLRELEEAGLVQRTLLERPASSAAYELTSYGFELDDALVHLGVWGARSLGRPQPSDVFSVASLRLALRGAFNREKAQGRDLFVGIGLNGGRLNVSVVDGRVSFPVQPVSMPSVTLNCAPDVFAELLTGYTNLDSAAAVGRINVQGARRTARSFFEIFRLPSSAQPLE
jgi:DNA-binding HxlR family transcriptional regulator